MCIYIMSFLWLNKNFISNENITHTSFMGGKWSIPNDKLNEFYKLCENEMQNGKINYYIERPQKIGMLLIDIDLRFDYDEVKERAKNIFGIRQGKIFLCSYAGMGCHLFIRRNDINAEIEVFFMHSDSWGQYGFTEVGDLNNFVDGYEPVYNNAI